MNGAAQTKIFGLRVSLDPKFIVAGLIAVAALLFWYNSRSDEEAPSRPAVGTAPSSETIPQGAPAIRTPGSTVAGRGIGSAATGRRTQRTNDHATLRMRAIDPTHGDVDPTLRLDLLARLQAIQETGNSRKVFSKTSAGNNRFLV